MPTWPTVTAWPATGNWPNNGAWPSAGNWPSGSAQFTPADLPNLALWMNGDSVAAFSDAAGTTPVTAPNGRVRRIDQPAPLTGSWLAISDPVRPFRETNALDCQLGAGMQISQPAGITIPAADSSVGIAFHVRAAGSGVTAGANPALFGSDGGNWGFDVVGPFTGASTGLLILHGGAVWTPGFSLFANSTFAGVLTNGTAGLSLKYSVNGAAAVTVTVAAVPTGNIATMVIGRGLAFSACLSVSQVVATSAGLSGANIDLLLAYLSSKLPSFPLNAPLVAGLGDSIMAGTGATNPTAWMYAMQGNLNGSLATPPRILNAGFAGYTLAQMTADYHTLVRPAYNASRGKNVLIVAGGSNDMVDAAGRTAAQIISDTYALCDMARADGWLVVLASLLPRTDAGTVGVPAKRALVNADTSVNWPSHADAYANVAAIVGMGADLDPNSTTNYSADKVHPNPTGNGLEEPVYRSAVLTLIP